MQELLNAIWDPTLTPRQVSDRVNSVRNNGLELVEPAGRPDGLALIAQ